MVIISRNKIRVELGKDSYDVHFGRNLFPKIASNLKRAKLGSRYVIVTDDNKALRDHADNLAQDMRNKGLDTFIIHVEEGEASKTREEKKKIENIMLGEELGRDSVLIALGGGKIGDLAGFVAATYQRGIPYVQVPTTVLAQADSSVGGKVAVDTEFGKNQIGVFKQPWAVYIDIETLKTLPIEQIQNGLAETIKHGVIQDAKFFRWLEDHIDDVILRKPRAWKYIAMNNVRIKASVVEKDPHEKGLRRILNYGHTIGHAVEKLADYGEDHGRCVAMGMLPAALLAHELNGFPIRTSARQFQLLRRTGLPIFLPEEYKTEDILELTLRDKKAKGGKARYTLPFRLGDMARYNGTYATHVDSELVCRVMEACRSLSALEEYVGRKRK